MMPLTGHLNNSVAGLGSPGPNGIDLICNKAMCGPHLVSKHFWSVNLSLMHASTYPLLWWWYNDENACFMFRLLQNIFNLSEIKLPPESDIIFFGKPYSEKKKKTILHVSIMLSADKSSWQQGLAVMIYNAKVVCIV